MEKATVFFYLCNFALSYWSFLSSLKGFTLITPPCPTGQSWCDSSSSLLFSLWEYNTNWTFWADSSAFALPTEQQCPFLQYNDKCCRNFSNILLLLHWHEREISFGFRHFLKINAIITDNGFSYSFFHRSMTISWRMLPSHSHLRFLPSFRTCVSLVISLKRELIKLDC